jgi:hypothetical protein
MRSAWSHALISVHHLPSARRLAAAAPPLIPTLQALFQANLALALFAADTLRCSLHGSNPDREELVGQV